MGDAAGDEVVAQKKSLNASEQSRPDVAAAREVFFEQIKDVPLQDIVVLDESYATTKFTRLRGRAPRGVRLRSSVPHGHWKLLTIIAAMTLRGVQAAMTIDAATDTDVFGAFVERVLVPTLRPGQVVIMDNLAAHKVGWIVAMIERAGCRVVFLPPYSSPCRFIGREPGLQPDRADVVEGKAVAAQRRGADDRRLGESRGRRAHSDHRIRLPRILRPLRLHATDELKVL